jgi:hypothetical protein
MLDMPGCSKFGKKIVYFDGHGHANQIVPAENGYLMGAHGIMGMSPQNFSVSVAAEYGFFYVHSNPTELHYCQEIFSDTLPALYSDFNASTINDDKYYEILKCLEEKSGGIGDCVSLCEQWPYFGKEEPTPSVVSLSPSSVKPTTSPASPPSNTPKPTTSACTKTQAVAHGMLTAVIIVFFYGM